MADQLFSNNAETVLSAGVAAIDTTIYVTTGTGDEFQSPTAGDWELLTLEDANKTKIEIVKVTARAGDVLTVVRAQEGTTAQIFDAGDIVDTRITSGTMEEIQANIAAALAAASGGFDPDVDEVVIANLATTASLKTVSIGYSSNTPATSDYAVAIGSNAYSSGANSVALGKSASSSGADSIAIGGSANSDAATCITIGKSAYSQYSDSITIGNAAYTFSSQTIAIGVSAKCGVSGSLDDTNAIAIGNLADAREAGGIAIGYSTYIPAGDTNAIVIGYDADARGIHAITLGSSSACYNDKAIAIGSLVYANNIDSIAIGTGASSSGDNGIAIGKTATARINNTHTIAAPSISRKDSNESAGLELISYSSQENYIFSEEFDLTQVAANDVVSITIPSGASFYPEEVGVIVTSANTVTVQPTFSFGVTGTPAALLAATITTKSVAKGRDVFDTLITGDGQTSLTASITITGAATTLLGRVYFKGLMLEDE